MRISVMLAFGAVLGSPMVAAAQDTVQQPAAGCLCVLPNEAGPQVAAVQDIQGQVLLSGAEGYTPNQSNAELSVGDSVVLLDDAQAVLRGPACRVALAPDSMTSLVSTETGICVAQAVTASGTPPREMAGGGRLTGAQIPGLIVSGDLVKGGVADGVIESISGGGAPPPVSP